MALEGQEEVQADGEHIEERPPSTPTDANIAMRCVLNDNLARFVKCFEEEDDPFRETVSEMMNERDEHGKTPIDMASILGRVDMMKELITRGAECTLTTKTGYTALHHAACWGQIMCLKTLVENGANLQQKTQHGERAREVAVRYNQAECVDYLDWAEAKQALITVITIMQETIADPEKVQGRLTRDDKNVATNACKEKMDWVENTLEATTQDFINMLQLLQETLEPINIKLSEPPPEKPEKK